MEILGSLEVEKNNMDKIWSIAKKYRVIIFAIFVGVIVVSPNIISIIRLGDNFQGIYPMFNNDENHYLAMTREMTNIKGFSGNVFYVEHKNDAYVFPMLSQKLFGIISKKFNISIPALFVLNDFLLPVLSFIFLYLLFKTASHNKKYSIIFSLIYFLFFWYSYGRPFNPQFNSIVFFIGLILTINIFQFNSKKNYFKIIILSSITALLVYMYPYYWTSLFVLFIVNLILAFKDIGMGGVLKRFIIYIFIFILLATPYLINLNKLIESSVYAETARRVGIINTRLPASFGNIFLTIFSLLALLMASKRFSKFENKVLAFSFPITSLILNWQNIITGKYLQFSSHYYHVSIVFIFILFLMIIRQVSLVNFKSCFNRRNMPVIAIIIISISVVGFKQRGELLELVKIPFEKGSTPNLVEMQQYDKLFNWTNSKISAGDVIYTNDNMLRQLLPIYTDLNLYYYGYGRYYLVSDDEVEHRWLVNNFFNKGVDEKYIQKNNMSIWGNKFIDEYQSLKVQKKVYGKLININLRNEIVPKAVVEELLSKKKNIVETGFENSLKKYKIDYLFLNKIDKNKEIFNAIKFTDKIKVINNIEIYKVN